MTKKMPLATQKRLILSVLGAHADNQHKPECQRIPWHITPEGWAEFCRHWSQEVREAAQSHPGCPDHLRLKARA